MFDIKYVLCIFENYFTCAVMSFYEILGVDRTCSQNDIKVAFKRLLLVHHPDKGGNNEFFVKLSDAYGTLKDPTLRKIYDAKLDMEENSSSAFDSRVFNESSIYNMINNVIGNIVGKNQRECVEKKQNEPIVLTHRCVLKDLFSDEPLQIKAEIMEMCSDCNGTGSLDGTWHACQECKGSGISVIIPFIVHKGNLSICKACNGTGVDPLPHNLCHGCRGRCTRMVSRNLNVRLGPENVDSMSVIMDGSGGYPQSLRMKPSDLHVNLQIEHDETYYIRDSCNLVTHIDLTLKQALCGASIQLLHPKNETILIDIESIVFPGMEHTIPDLGLPTKLKPSGYGDLVIVFHVIFPEKLEPRQVSLISRALE
jgi:DnaJ homolog subfamily A member 2